MGVSNLQDPVRGGKLLPAGPTLEVTDLTMRESAPGLRRFLCAIPLVALPWVLSLYLHSTNTCSGTPECAMQTNLGLRLLQALVGTANVPASLVDTPLLADLLVGLLVWCLVYFVCVLFAIPPFGGAAVLVKKTEMMQARTGKAFDFPVREKARPYCITLHITGQFTGYPGDVMLSIRLDLPEAKPLNIERTVKPLAEPVKKGMVQEYVFDPVHFQFTSPYTGPAHMWVGYGMGPGAKVRVEVKPRG